MLVNCNVCITFRLGSHWTVVISTLFLACDLVVILYSWSNWSKTPPLRVFYALDYERKSRVIAPPHCAEIKLDSFYIAISLRRPWHLFSKAISTCNWRDSGTIPPKCECKYSTYKAWVFSSFKLPVLKEGPLPHWPCWPLSEYIKHFAEYTFKWVGAPSERLRSCSFYHGCVCDSVFRDQSDVTPQNQTGLKGCRYNIKVSGASTILCVIWYIL